MCALLVHTIAALIVKGELKHSGNPLTLRERASDQNKHEGKENWLSQEIEADLPSFPVPSCRLLARRPHHDVREKKGGRKKKESYGKREKRRKMKQIASASRFWFRCSLLLLPLLTVPLLSLPPAHQSPLMSYIQASFSPLFLFLPPCMPRRQGERERERENWSLLFPPAVDK